MEDNYIIGRNPVLEAIRAGHGIDKIYIKDREADGSLKKIMGAAKAAKIPVVLVDRTKLDRMAEGGNHQGVIASASAHEYVSVAQLISAARDKGEAPFIVVCDRISDPHNLGAIIRTANAAGVHGIIIPKHESVGLNAAVAKAAAGALEYTPVARVANIAKTLDDLKSEGLWITGADAAGEKTLYETDFSGATALVIGSEGSGISRLVKEKCDFLVSIPMRGQTESLNASVAAALLMYEAAKGR